MFSIVLSRIYCVQIVNVALLSGVRGNTCAVMDFQPFNIVFYISFKDRQKSWYKDFGKSSESAVKAKLNFLQRRGMSFS